jgi:hypothetical protein
MKLADVFPRVLNRAWNHRQTHKPEVPLQFPHDFRPRGSFGVQHTNPYRITRLSKCWWKASAFAKSACFGRNTLFPETA